MSVELEPPELGFRRPFTVEVTQILKLTNNNSDPVAFKVKTTAPKQYCVRPNSGSILPGKSVEVQVLLQAMKEDPPLDAKCRDKFLVQSVAIDAEQAKAVDNVWANLDHIAKDDIKERKIRVTFLPAHGTAQSGVSVTKTNGAVQHPDPLQSHPNTTQSGHDLAPPAYAPPSPPSQATSPTTVHSTARDFATPSKSGSDDTHGASALLSSNASSGLSNSPNSESTAPTAPITEKAADLYNSAAASLSNTASSAGETLQHQLDAAKDQILSLKEQIQSQNLRQRSTAATTGNDIKTASDPSSDNISRGSSLQTQAASADGVPVQIVAALCLLSFLIAYFFF